MKPTLALIMPCFNEEGVLIQSIPVIERILKELVQKQRIADDSFILLVDDGSIDNTWQEIQHLHNVLDYDVRGLKLARNFGHQNAVLAGMMHVKDDVDVCITMDCDLQDDPSVIGEMLICYSEGKQVVYGVRRSRNQDSISKKWFAQSYYKLLKYLRIDVVEDHADYRLLSKQVLNHLVNFKEVNLFLRGLVPLIGYPNACVYYDRPERVAGETKYNLFKMVSLAVDGISGFSAAPLIFIMWFGFLVSFFAVLLGIWALVVKFVTGDAISGWTSIVVPMYFLGGIQIFTLGVIGIYTAKIFKEVKARPRFIIETELVGKSEKRD